MGTDPFPGMKHDGSLSEIDLMRALRLDLEAEEDAISLYTAHAMACEDNNIRNKLLDIADEERVHTGELLALLSRLDRREATLIAKGAREAVGEKGLNEIIRAMMEE